MTNTPHAECKRARHLASVILFALTSALIIGCASTAQAPQPTTQVQSYHFPVFEPLPETVQSQNKGGLQIFVAPVTYEVKWKEKLTVADADPSFTESLLGGAAAGASGKDMRYVRAKRVPVPTIEPNRLRFLVRINNQMPHVFRGAGTVVQFNINGQLRGVSQAGYRNLVQAIVPPRSQVTVEIYGPKLSTLPDKATIGLFFYDVVTGQNDAGEVTERQNFEWYYTYVRQVRSDTVTVTVEEGWIPVR